MAHEFLHRRDNGELPQRSASRPSLSVLAPPTRGTPLDLHPAAEVYERLEREVHRGFPGTKAVVILLDATAVLLSIWLARVAAGGRVANGGEPGSFLLAATTLPV